MSDAVVISLITGVTTTIASIVAAWVSITNAKTIKDLEKNTNSIKDALVAATRASALQEGHTQGVADQKAVPPVSPTTKTSQ